MNFIDPRPALLGPDAPVPIDVPFSRAAARAEGVTDRQLSQWTGEGLLENPLRGVYHAAQLAAGPELRIACLKLVMPPDAVATDRTAGWLWGASMILAPNDHLAVPPVSMFLSPGNRLRNKLVLSGERSFTPGQVIELPGGVLVTSKLRTTCDLGRLLHRDQGFAGMEQMMAIADYDHAQLCEQGRVFKGCRGVVQFRGLVPWVDGRPQSPPESILRLRWLDCSTLPPPLPQVAVEGPFGWYYLDAANEELKYAAEYDGKWWHGPEQREHDASRRGWMVEDGGWHIDVFEDHHLFGPLQNAEERLIRGVADARRALGRRAWRGQDRRTA